MSKKEVFTKDLKAAIKSGNEEDVNFEVRRLLINLAWGIDELEELEETAEILYDYMEEKRKEKEMLKDDLI